MPKINAFATLSAALLLSACAETGGIDMSRAVGVGVGVGVGVAQAATLDETQVQQAASLAAKELDGKSTIAAAGSKYDKRLTAITRDFHNYDGLDLNFKVYVNKEINAFAMADGTVRVYTGLLDVMPDDQVAAVIGHEIGHVRLKHSYKQMREQLLTDTAFEAVVAVGGTLGSLSSSQLGKLAQTAVSARFSQSDELEADAFAVKFLKQTGRDPYAMKRAIQTLEAKAGGGGGFLSSHPSSASRIKTIESAIKG